MKAKRNGFTLVEILLVALVIGILMAIAIPGMLHARSVSQTKTCIQNLWQIEQGKEEYAMAAGLGNGSVVEGSDLSPDYIKVFPAFPAGGTYLVGPVGDNPTCSVSGHTLQGTGMQSGANNTVVNLPSK